MYALLEKSHSFKNIIKCDQLIKRKCEYSGNNSSDVDELNYLTINTYECANRNDLDIDALIQLCRSTKYLSLIHISEPTRPY